MNHLRSAIGLAQALAEMHFAPRGATRSIAIPSYRKGFAASVDAGRYSLTGSGVLLRASPSASSNVLGTLNFGDTVEVFGDPVETDSAYTVGANGAAVPNDGSSPGIDYVHVGTENYGAGWVAADFLAKAVSPAQMPPAPKGYTYDENGKLVPISGPAGNDVTNTSTSTQAAAASKSYVTPVLIGGLIGMAVLGSVALGIREYNKQRRHANA